jgi:hypothetical protein
MAIRMWLAGSHGQGYRRFHPGFAPHLKGHPDGWSQGSVVDRRSKLVRQTGDGMAHRNQGQHSSAIVPGFPTAIDFGWPNSRTGVRRTMRNRATEPKEVRFTLLIPLFEGLLLDRDELLFRVRSPSKWHNSRRITTCERCRSETTNGSKAFLGSRKHGNQPPITIP